MKYNINKIKGVSLIIVHFIKFIFMIGLENIHSYTIK